VSLTHPGPGGVAIHHGEARPRSPLTGDAPPARSLDHGFVTEHYDVIIAGSGAGGGTPARTPASSGKRILLLERGDFLPRELANWDPKPVFVAGKYIADRTS